MKKIFSNKKTLICLGVTIIVIIFLASGFKIVYAPGLANDWEAIGACASWVTALCSVIAAMIAIHIPKLIAEQQNKIALFEKRFSFYYLLLNCIVFSKVINNDTTDLYIICTWFEVTFGDYTELKTLRDNRTEFIRAVSLFHYDVIADLEKGKFLFDMDFDDYIQRLSNGISKIMECQNNREKLPNYCAEYIRAAEDIELKIIPKVKKELRLK